ncbi:replication initiation regulator SeqA [Mergibacter septicus]|uniref:replication initiation negative regulator SeqA n=1 Tax=Mergibacter septicus TaxID=221402 RepID=UPI001C75F5F7|nr:replication initiation negative regulator SeqA [Mergibacter septicus]QDJ12670.1 replication initiation regulator SeqA [Mergibacter septicus]
MRTIEIDDELYQYLASNTRSIGEGASDILRRLLNLPPSASQAPLSTKKLAYQQEELPITLNTPTSITTNEGIFPKTKKLSDDAINLSVKRVNTVLHSNTFQNENKTVNRFLLILTALYRSNPESFAQAVESIVGRSRTYFARDEATLLTTGNHTKPKQIPETPYWVITNTNSARKMLMLEGTMQAMQLPPQLIEQIKPYFVN